MNMGSVLGMMLIESWCVRASKRWMMDTVVFGHHLQEHQYDFEFDVKDLSVMVEVWNDDSGDVTKICG
ncbi:hypothetical protein BC936DRAFT_147397 [Jimgerdemannia flammicorona]|uniref:Uncharacterized protein n=1 Tax=Jimgerdemannia flammicorona TaxID=994334 RepID=A0A433D5E7_9FUNG|nr:hypothetical protein BC936DRAFT_147397 [Jimgerdemannia flammicorona]